MSIKIIPFALRSWALSSLFSSPEQWKCPTRWIWIQLVLELKACRIIPTKTVLTSVVQIKWPCAPAVLMHNTETTTTGIKTRCCHFYNSAADFQHVGFILTVGIKQKEKKTTQTNNTAALKLQNVLQQDSREVRQENAGVHYGRKSWQSWRCN